MAHTERRSLLQHGDKGCKEPEDEHLKAFLSAAGPFGFDAEELDIERKEEEDLVHLYRITFKSVSQRHRRA